MSRRRRAIALLPAVVAAVGAGVPALAGDEAGRSADQVLADAVAALRQMPGARVDGTVTDRHDHTVSRIHAVVVGPQEVGGRPAVVLADAGDVPGSAPERIAVADATPAVPLRITLTGPRRRGTPAAAHCDPAETSVAAEGLRLTPLSTRPRIAAPKHAKTLRALLGTR